MTDPRCETYLDDPARFAAHAADCEKCAKIVAQLDECVEGHALVPLRTQPLDHLRKPYSLRVTGGHAGLL